jgi:thiol:disulfide interchange protein DsbA
MIRKMCIVFTILISMLNITAYAMVITEGQQYQVLPANLPSLDSAAKPNQVVVTEFFSLACPHCFAEQPYVNVWLKTKPQNVVFQRIPVGFDNPEWVPLAKTYYVLQALGKAQTLTPLIFNAIHVQGQALFTEEAIAAFCANYGIDPTTFKQYYDSFSIAQQLQQSDQLAETYGILGVPSIVVGNQYLTDAGKAGGKEHLMDVVQQLVDQLQKSAIGS